MNQINSDIKEKVRSATENDTEEPSMFTVYLHNDDYTTMEFVVDILMTVFNKTPEEATTIMLKVHREGIGRCGVYTFEVAETKVLTVQRLAQIEGFPLKCTMEKD
jgi:ATP-dependent Clp protease adaptor protein ClpS